MRPTTPAVAVAPWHGHGLMCCDARKCAMAASRRGARCQRRWHYGWLVAGVTFACLCIGGGIRAAPGVLLPALSADTGWSRAVLSGAISINILLYGLIGPFAAALMLAFGVKRAMLGALVVLALGVSVAATATDVWQLYLLWGIAVGLGSGFIAGVLGAVVADRWFVERKGLVMGLFSASTSSGQLVFAPLLAAIVEGTHSWRTAALTMGAVAAGAVPFVAWLMVDTPSVLGLEPYGVRKAKIAAPSASTDAAATASAAVSEPSTQLRTVASSEENTGERDDEALRPESPNNAHSSQMQGAAQRQEEEEEEKDGQEPWRPPNEPTDPQARMGAPTSKWQQAKTAMASAVAALRFGVTDKDFWLLAGSFWVCGASTNGLIGTHLVSACVDHGINEVTAAGLLSSMGVLDVVGTVGSGWLSDRYPPQRLLAVYYFLRGLSLLALPWAFDASLGGLWPFAVVYGLDWIATVPPTKKLCDACYGGGRSAHSPSVMFGWCLAAHQVGAAMAAAGAGAVRSAFGSYATAFLFSGGVCVLAALVVLNIGRASPSWRWRSLEEQQQQQQPASAVAAGDGDLQRESVKVVAIPTALHEER